jgi:molybdopterin-guanine dinucleotide biosynthesis protein B
MQESKIIAFVGYSGSGKTTLITNIIKILSQKGYKIGTIKHTHHDFEIDKPGKDSYLHFHSGSYASMIISNEKMAFVKKNEHLDIKLLFQKYFSDCDLLIIEGFKDYNIPKILVHRKEIKKESLLDSLNMVIAIASDEKLNTNIPNFDINDILNIANFIEKEFIIKNKHASLEQP